MKITFEWGQKGRHSLRRQNEALIRALESMTGELERAKAKIESVEQYSDLLVVELNQLIKEKNEARTRREANQAAIRALEETVESPTPTTPDKPLKQTDV